MKACYLGFAVAWLVSVGAGCTSVPVHYYTLASPPGNTLSALETALVIDVRVVHTPPHLNRSSLMVRTGPTELTLLENERWASPVNDEIQDALRLALQRRLGRMTGLRPALEQLTLAVDLHVLEAELGRYALLEASWSATLSARAPTSTDARATTCTFQAEEKIRTGYAGIVEGYQREIAALAEEIVAELSSPTNGIDVPCHKSIDGSAGGSGLIDYQASGDKYVSPSSPF